MSHFLRECLSKYFINIFHIYITCMGPNAQTGKGSENDIPENKGS